jgi:hypothetical protein
MSNITYPPCTHLSGWMTGIGRPQPPTSWWLFCWTAYCISDPECPSSSTNSLSPSESGTITEKSLTARIWVDNTFGSLKRFHKYRKFPRMHPCHIHARMVQSFCVKQSVHLTWCYLSSEMWIDSLHRLTNDPDTKVFRRFETAQNNLQTQIDFDHSLVYLLL